jgi:hypothetical protein
MTMVLSFFFLILSRIAHGRTDVRPWVAHHEKGAEEVSFAPVRLTALSVFQNLDRVACGLDAAHGKRSRKD